MSYNQSVYANNDIGMDNNMVLTFLKMAHDDCYIPWFCKYYHQIDNNHRDRDIYYLKEQTRWLKENIFEIYYFSFSFFFITLGW